MSEMTKMEKIEAILACPAWDGYKDADVMNENCCEQEVDEIYDSLGIVEEEMEDGNRDEEGYVVGQTAI